MFSHTSKIWTSKATVQIKQPVFFFEAVPLFDPTTYSLPAVVQVTAVTRVAFHTQVTGCTRRCLAGYLKFKDHYTNLHKRWIYCMSVIKMCLTSWSDAVSLEWYSHRPAYRGLRSCSTEGSSLYMYFYDHSSELITMNERFWQLRSPTGVKPGPLSPKERWCITHHHLCSQSTPRIGFYCLIQKGLSDRTKLCNGVHDERWSPFSPSLNLCLHKWFKSALVVIYCFM